MNNDFMTAVEDFADKNNIITTNEKIDLTDENINKKTSKKSLTPIIQNIVDKSKVNSLVIDQIRDTYVVSGKTLKEWDNLFTIKIPQTITSAEHEKLVQTLNNLYHIATFHIANSSISIEALTGEEKILYLEALTQITNQYAADNKRMPSADTLKSLSEEHTTPVRDALTYAKNYKQIFSVFLDRVKFNEKLLTQVTINRGYELKLNK